MLDIAREAARVRVPVLAASATAWVALGAGPVMHMPGAVCSAGGGFASSTLTALPVVLALNPPSALAAGWALMLVAMMSPPIVPAIHHVRFTSLTRRRARAIALFVAGYGSVWMMCGAILMAGAALAMASMPASYMPAAAVALVAAAWQASPLKQRCLNRCHDTPPLRAFGLAADLDALRFGWAQGLWCAASCGALMALPLLLPKGHLAAMAAVAVLIFCERLEGPARPQWRMRGLGKAARIVAARARIRWRPVRRDVEALRTTTVTFEQSGGVTRVVLRDLYPSKQALDDAIASQATSGSANRSRSWMGCSARFEGRLLPCQVARQKGALRIEKR